MEFEHGKNTIKAVGFRKSSGEQKSKLKSLANFTHVIIEEADEISEEDFMQLDDSLRTVKEDIMIILVLNPPSAEHWLIKRFFELIEIFGVDGYFTAKVNEEYAKKVLYINTNYENNVKNMSQNTIDNYEGYRFTKLHYYYNVIKGYVAQVVFGKIYKGWRIIDEVPFEARLVRRGGDFGYSVDPTVIEDIYEYNGGYIIDEIFYRKGASNKVIADFLLAQNTPDVLNIFDSAEPKSIQEIEDHGVTIIGATKGPGSVSQGIDFLQTKKISLTKRSLKTRKAYDNYTWKTSKSGESLQVPDDSIHEWSNPMDAIRYGFDGTLGGVGESLGVQMGEVMEEPRVHGSL
jgi:phage terminase large subunit